MAIGSGYSQRNEAFVRQKYDLPDDVRDWHYDWAIRDVSEDPDRQKVRPVAYRPFDRRHIYYTGRARGIVGWPVKRVMRHFVGDNLGISIGRQGQVVGSMIWNLAFAHSEMTDFNMFYRGGALTVPLYSYPDEKDPQVDAFEGTSRALNFDAKIYAAICKSAKLTPSPAAGEGDAFRVATGDDRPTEVKVFDYIYGVLHSPNYRETYAEFLKIDFPRIPFPRDAVTFAHVSAKGEALRRLHLMEAAAIGDTTYPYHGDGVDVVAPGHPKYEKGAVYINADQYFEAVPALTWGFHIGGYQPAQKWLKDRRGRTLSYDDIGHYQKIVKILTETDRIMKEIKLPLNEAGQ